MRIKEKWYEELTEKELEHLYNNKDKIKEVPFFLDKKITDLINDHFNQKIKNSQKIFILKLIPVFTSVIVLFIFSIFFITNKYLKPFCIISKIKGNVYVLKNTKELATNNRKIKEKGYIITDRNSTAEITFKNNTKININNESKLFIDQLSYNKKKNIEKLYLNNGKIELNVAKLNNNSLFEVKTGNIIIGVKGTIFSIENKNNNIHLIVNKGSVYLKLNILEINNKIIQISKLNKNIGSKVKDAIEERMYIEEGYELLLKEQEIKSINKDILDILLSLQTELKSYKSGKASLDSIISNLDSKIINIKDSKKSILKLTYINKIGKVIIDNQKQGIKIAKLRNYPGILVSNNQIYISTDNKNIYLANDNDKSIYSIDAETGKINWKINNTDLLKVTNPVYIYKSRLIISSPEYIFIFNTDGSLIEKIKIKNGSIYSSKILIKDDILYIPGSENVYKYDGKSLSIFEEIPASLGQIFFELKSDLLFCVYPNKKNIIIYSFKENKVIYQSDKFDNRILNSPIIINDNIYIADIQNTFYKINYKNNSLNKLNINSGVISNIIYLNNNLYFIDNNGWFNRVDINNFNKIIKIQDIDSKTDKEIYFSKKILKNKQYLYFCSNKGKLMKYNTLTSQIEFLDINNNYIELVGSPVLIENKIYFLDKKSSIYYIE